MLERSDQARRRKERRGARGIAACALALASLCIAATHSPAQESGRIQRGRVFAETNCSRCHAVGRVGPSPLRIAPPFRELHTRYPIEDLAEALSEGIVTGHPTMPEFQLDIAQIGDLIAYLKSLER